MQLTMQRLVLTLESKAPRCYKDVFVVCINLQLKSNTHPGRVTHKCSHMAVYVFFFTFHTGGPGSGCAGDLPRETGTFDGLRALLNLIFITAAMHGHHLTCPLLHLV